MIDKSIRQELKESDNSNQDDVDDEYQDVEFNFLPRQRAKKYINRSEISEDSSSSEYTTLSIGSESDNDPISGISEIFEDYSPPSYEPFQNPPYSESNYDQFLWMLLWIMNFQTKFNIAETVTETLIKFMKLALCEFSNNDFNDFSDSLYLTRKKLELNDQFHSFTELTLNRTYECDNGKRVCGALILVLCDIPAARKICGHVSALVLCHRCEKKANYENEQHNFAGMHNVGYSAQDSNEYWQNALGWRRCNSDAARKRFVKETGVR
ncbi:hypothetical protein GLOIN_2v1786478 [Rhizophagus irregularis DAOM 181602=DAOM 197198]|nr:hypothetical protein GLOIN_2v1786478 [Rhizophagus irregularis DAOM 181602=DAOM 197198]